MFGWLKKKPTHDELEYRAGVVYGQEVGRAIATAMVDYREKSFFPLRPTYINVLRERLQIALKVEDFPPLAKARSEFHGFMNEVEALPEYMMEETRAAMKDNIASARLMGAQDDLMKAMQEWCKGFAHQILLDGTTVLDQYLVPLQDADRAWRLKHPDLAALHPIQSVDVDPSK